MPHNISGYLHVIDKKRKQTAEKQFETHNSFAFFPLELKFSLQSWHHTGNSTNPTAELSEMMLSLLRRMNVPLSEERHKLPLSMGTLLGLLRW